MAASRWIKWFARRLSGQTIPAALTLSGNIVGANVAATGTITGTSTSASALAVGPAGATNPTLKVNSNTASAATGMEVVGAAAAGGVNLRAISSGTNENVAINAKGSGTVTLNPTGTGNVVSARAFVGSESIKSTSPTGGIGYATGAGGAVTQITDKTTAVELNALCGDITTVALDNAAGVDHSFTLTNSSIAAGDIVVFGTKSYGGTADGIPIANQQSTANGSCVVNVRNTGAVALDALAVISFAVIKKVTA